MVKDSILCSFFNIKIKRLSGNNRNRIYNNNKNVIFPKKIRLNKLFASKLKCNSSIFKRVPLRVKILSNNTLYIRRFTK